MSDVDVKKSEAIMVEKNGLSERSLEEDKIYLDNPSCR
jgi:hypothetical protein